MEIQLHDRTVTTDREGYLANLDDWSTELAERLAESEGIALTDAHWEVINFLREGFHEHGTVPNARQLQKAFTKLYGAEKGSSQYLYGLFPYGPAKQACRISGLPKPTGCV